MTHEQRRVRSDSDELLDALDELKRMETEKRGMPISSPPFHERAEAVDEQARHVFDLALREERDGDEAERTGATLEDAEPLREPVEGRWSQD